MPEITSRSGPVDDPFRPSLHVSTPLSPDRNIVPPDSSTSPSGFGQVIFQPTINDAASPSSCYPHADHHRAER
ncbi:hypothetical protein LTR14_011713, partial [Exophiala xenobiotica]